jgi:hypothetical protein
MPDPTVKTLLERYGRTYAEDAGIRLADRPAPLYQLLVLATLLSARRPQAPPPHRAGVPRPPRQASRHHPGWPPHSCA